MDYSEEDGLLSQTERKARGNARACWLVIAITWALSLAATALIVHGSGRLSTHATAGASLSLVPLPTYGSPPELEYATWPPPQSAMSAETLAAIGYGKKNPPRVDAEAIATKLQALGRRRQREGTGPAMLVLAGGMTGLGLGNTYGGLTAAAVLAEAIGAACLVTLGETYAKTLLKHVRPEFWFAYPCQIVSLEELDELRQQKLIPVIKNNRWRIAGLWNATGDGSRPTAGAFIIDYGVKYRELVCMPRFDAAKLLTPPGMHASEFWRRLRTKYEQWVHVSLQLPVEPHELQIESPTPPWSPKQGTLCGHLRLLHMESHRPLDRTIPNRLPSCNVHDCGGMLSAFEAIHTRRPFGSYFFTSGANCSHCIPIVAPTLFASATRLESGHKSRHIVEKSTFDDAEGAMADMRALARCAVVIVDDKAEGTFALALAAAGRLTPCIDPLEQVERWQPGFGSHFPHVKRTVDVAQWKTRALCTSDDPSAPVTPLPWPLAAGDLQALRDAIRFDVSRPWDPRHLPSFGIAELVGGQPWLNEACSWVMEGKDTPNKKGNS
mmetsp:Transcript_43555/g.107751  ORF Transcript_43555/g.107751 Transcript_43555/m.107751 type:complete len:552 (+) Transcript_43555:212-1867(+)